MRLGQPCRYVVPAQRRPSAASPRSAPREARRRLRTALPALACRPCLRLPACQQGPPAPAGRPSTIRDDACRTAPPALIRELVRSCPVREPRLRAPVPQTIRPAPSGPGGPRPTPLRRSVERCLRRPRRKSALRSVYGPTPAAPAASPRSADRPKPVKPPAPLCRFTAGVFPNPRTHSGEPLPPTPPPGSPSWATVPARPRIGDARARPASAAASPRRQAPRKGRASAARGGRAGRSRDTSARAPAVAAKAPRARALR